MEDNLREMKPALVKDIVLKGLIDSGYTVDFARELVDALLLTQRKEYERIINEMPTEPIIIKGDGQEIVRFPNHNLINRVDLLSKLEEV